MRISLNTSRNGHFLFHQLIIIGPCREYRWVWVPSGLTRMSTHVGYLRQQGSATRPHTYVSDTSGWVRKCV